ncbi:MAG: hypothetical protein JW734_00685 [Candidatus Omnitrophica bacterium]|nr:hypothetical protein [Candidatus Omnitrophota bacterium]
MGRDKTTILLIIGVFLVCFQEKSKAQDALDDYNSNNYLSCPSLNSSMPPYSELSFVPVRNSFDAIELKTLGETPSSNKTTKSVTFDFLVGYSSMGAQEEYESFFADNNYARLQDPHTELYLWFKSLKLNGKADFYDLLRIATQLTVGRASSNSKYVSGESIQTGMWAVGGEFLESKVKSGSVIDKSALFGVKLLSFTFKERDKLFIYPIIGYFDREIGLEFVNPYDYHVYRHLDSNYQYNAHWESPFWGLEFCTENDYFRFDLLYEHYWDLEYDGSLIYTADDLLPYSVSYRGKEGSNVEARIEVDIEKYFAISLGFQSLSLPGDDKDRPRYNTDDAYDFKEFMHKSLGENIGWNIGLVFKFPVEK